MSTHGHWPERALLLWWEGGHTSPGPGGALTSECPLGLYPGESHLQEQQEASRMLIAALSAQQSVK